MGGANLQSAKRGLQLLFGVGSARQHKSVATPRYIRHSVLLLCWMLLLHYAISAVDLAIHINIEPAMVIENTRMNASINATSLLYSRPFNTTKCVAYAQQSDTTPPDETCGLLE